MSTLVIAPHPDDELLGCGGLMLRRAAEKMRTGWVIMTGISEADGWPMDRVREREQEIEAVREGLGVERQYLYRLGYPTTRLDTVPLADLVDGVAECIRHFKPREVLLPYWGDAHSDHRVTFEAVSACIKWFRYPTVRRVMAYETLSETEFGLNTERTFNPNVYVDISPWIDRKLQLLESYGVELGEFPFPRSARAVRALAELRGSRAGYGAAEGYMLLMELEDVSHG